MRPEIVFAPSPSGDREQHWLKKRNLEKSARPAILLGGQGFALPPEALLPGEFDPEGEAPTAPPGLFHTERYA